MQFFTTLATLAAALFPFGAIAAPARGANGLEAYPSQAVGYAAAGNMSSTYIIVLREDTDDAAFESHQSWVAALHKNRLARRDDPRLTGWTTKYTFGKFKGYSGTFDQSTIDQIRLSPEVDFVEENYEMSTCTMSTQSNAPSWGLPRISHSSNYELKTYYYDSSAGAGVTVYIIDTGININHQEFGGRATWGFNNADNINSDLNGHGSHVSGIVAGTTFGVAKKASLVAVKVMGKGGTGNNAGIIGGIQWVVSHAKRNGHAARSVANMSLGGAFSTAVNRAVEAAISTGITFVVAAGNSNTDASKTSPASAGSAITVGSTDRTDTRSTFSNYGRFVDVFAPGTDITSSWMGSTSATHKLSGTSMASPHVAGLAATIMSAEGLSGAAAVTQRIFRLAMANRGVVKNAGKGSNGWLVYNNSGRE